MGENFSEKQPPPSISSEEHLAQLEAEFEEEIFSRRPLVVCYLKTSPGKQEEIINNYLQFPELLKDTNNLGQFLAFWLLEFFQKADTGPVEKLLNFIKTSALRPLPSELHRGQEVKFLSLFLLF